MLLGEGGIIRNHYGETLQAFLSFYGIYTNMEAEANALLVGVKLCVTLGFDLVLVIINSQALLQALNRKEPLWRIDQ